MLWQRDFFIGSALGVFIQEFGRREGSPFATVCDVRI